jgi:hypothetical protein
MGSEAHGQELVPTLLKGKGCTECTNGYGVIVLIVVRIENYNQPWCNANVLGDPDAIKPFYVNCGIRFTSLTSQEVSSIHKTRTISAGWEVTAGNLGGLTDVKASQVPFTQEVWEIEKGHPVNSFYAA